jgi:hypothetical protein
MEYTLVYRLFVASAVVCGLAVAPPDAFAEGDKSQYTLFNPTPRERMRELSTDRPDTTESPYTVDAGHFQAELSLVDFTRDDDGGVKSETLTALPSNLKVGLLNNVDLQLVFDPYVNQRVKVAGRSVRQEGFGDTTIRLKVNLLGNDEGPVAVGVMPYVTFPTSTHDVGLDRAQYGLIVPVSVELPAGFELGAMIEIDVVRDAANKSYGTELLHTVTLGHELYGELRGYVEYAGIAPIDAGSTYRAVIGTGLTYGLSDDTQLDAGVNFGVSDAADDYNLFVGVSFRI